MKLIIFLVVLIVHFWLMPAAAAEYGVARTSTPVLNTPDLKGVFGGGDGQSLKADRCGQLRELEHIALPGTVFTILKKQGSGAAGIYQVETDDYPTPANVRLYVDSRFLALEHTLPAPRRPQLPPREEVLSALRGAVGTPYVWGGNVQGGVPELAELFYNGYRGDDVKRLTLAGLDCSGLLYQATGGWTPRNSSRLISFGRGVAISGKQAPEIAALLQPLDLLVWNGHVIIVLDRQSAIESRLQCGKPGNGGVVITPLPQRVAEIMRTRRPVDSWPEGRKRQDIFVVRRWYGR